MHHAIMPREILDGDGANVLGEVAVGRDDTFPSASLEQAEIASGHRVAGLLEQIDEVRADIALVARDEHFHRRSLPNNNAANNNIAPTHVPAKWPPVRRQEHAPNETAFTSASMAPFPRPTAPRACSSPARCPSAARSRCAETPSARRCGRASRGERPPRWSHR